MSDNYVPSGKNFKSLLIMFITSGKIGVHDDKIIYSRLSYRVRSCRTKIVPKEEVYCPWLPATGDAGLD